MKKTKSSSGRGAKLRASQVAFYAVIGVLLGVSALFGIGCLLLEYTLQGAVVLASDIVLALFLVEFVRMDRAANMKRPDENLGAVLMSIEDVSVKWSDGTRDFATVELREQGISIRGEKVSRTDPWVAVSGYGVLNDHQVRLVFAADVDCVVTCDSRLKCAAAASVLCEHVACVEA